jgi:hypothetical protein
MIITKLKGGLGNQMFQYATGRFLALQNRTDLALDHKGYEKTKNSDTPREFELDKFNLQYKKINSSEIHKIKNPSGQVSRIHRAIKQKIFSIKHLDYSEHFLNQKINKDIYLNGFFQSEKNFLPIRDVLLKEFTLKEEFQSELSKKISGQISAEINSVSIHIRRGDYASDQKTKNYHGTCSLSYYEKAISLIKEKIDNPYFYIFSDDVEWVKNNLELDCPHKIISGNNLLIQEELILMSHCKHNIIANSSFSWWGAWLNQNNDKIIIAPTPWVNKKPNPHPNILPESWITLPKN